MTFPIVHVVNNAYSRSVRQNKRANMSQLISQVYDYLMELDMDSSMSQSREVKLFGVAVVLIPVTYCVVEICKFLWKIR